ncbi:MAG: tetratricopeptide repeat protein [Candidatus Obscuribacterales bacterium]|nr:tetratricopeptide repeat protein [Candidatus Obscuribacterales bacterium]
MNSATINFNRLALLRRHVVSIVLLSAVSVAGTSCSTRVSTAGDHLGEVSQGTTSSTSSNASGPGAAVSGERFDSIAEQEITDGTLKAWRVAISHDKTRNEMSADEWTKAREQDEQVAMKQLESLAESHPKASFIKTMMGQVKHHFGKEAEAAKYYEEALAKNRHDPLLTFKLAEARRVSGEAKKAEEFYRETLELQPDFDDARIGLAKCLLRRDKASVEARTLIEEVLKNNPQNKDALDLQRTAGKTAAR